MNMYEKTIHDYAGKIIIREMPLPKDIKGLYSDGCIAINKDLSAIEKRCILMEEIGHYFLTHGDILNLKDIENKKQENKARDWAVRNAIPIDAIKTLQNDESIDGNYYASEVLEVTEEMLNDAIEYYKRKEKL